MNIHFITFGSSGYELAIKRICLEAGKFEIFDSITGYNHSNAFDTDFKNNHMDFIATNRRLYGYGIWKPYIVLKELNKMKDGDILLYCDAGCELKNTGKKRMLEYINMVKESKVGILGFQLKHLERCWTKMDLIKHLNTFEELNTAQVLSGIFFVRKCDTSVNLFKKWYEISHNYHLIDDSPSIIPNHSEFKEHRHDQSVFSLLCKTMGASYIPDETYIEENNKVIWKPEMPIWASRRRHS